MTAGVLGMLLGLAGSIGLVLAFSYAPPFRSVRLVDRLAPYVHDAPPPSRLLGTATEPGLLRFNLHQPATSSPGRGPAP